MDESYGVVYPRYVITGTIDWQRIANLGETVELAPHEMLVHPAKPPYYCYVILSGCMVAKKFRHDQEAVAFNIRRRGSLLFESHSVTGTMQREVYFEALEPTVVRRITKEELNDAMAHDTKVCVALVDSVFAKLAASMDQTEDSHTVPAKERLFYLLTELAQSSETEQGDDAWLRPDVKLSQQMMADILCMNRVTVAKTLNVLKEEGLIRTEGRTILVKRTQI